MTPTEAARLLDLPEDAGASAVEERSAAMAAALEEKVAKALTPGLKAHYGKSLQAIGEARAVLLGPGQADPVAAAVVLGLAADASRAEIEARAAVVIGTLEEKVRKAPTPGLQSRYREALHRTEQARDLLLQLAPEPAPAAAPVAPTSDGTAGRKIWPLVAVAVLVIAAGWGGWQWLAQKQVADRVAAEAQAREEARAAEEARLAEEQRRQAAAEQRQAEERRAEEERAREAERQQREAQAAALRGRLEQAKTLWTQGQRFQAEAGQDLEKLRGQSVSGQAGIVAEWVARREAREDQTAWLADFLGAHPAVRLLPEVAARLEAGQLSEAETPLTELEAALAELMPTLRRESAARLVITGSLTLNSTPPGVAWEATDARGRVVRGQTPATLKEVAPGPAQIVFRRPSWPEVSRTVDVRRQQAQTATAEFVPGSVKIDSQPAGAAVLLNGSKIGVTPFQVAEQPPGDVAYQLELDGYLPASVTGQVTAGQALVLAADLKPRITEADYPVVYFYRPGAFTGMAVDVRVHLAGQLLAELGNRSHVAVRLKPGWHRFALEWWGGRTPDYAADFAPNRTYYILTALDGATKVKLTGDKGVGYAVRSEFEALDDLEKSRGDRTPRLLTVEPEPAPIP